MTEKEVHFPRIRELVDQDQKHMPDWQKKPAGVGLQCPGPIESRIHLEDKIIQGYAILAVQLIRGKLYGCCNIYVENGECHHVADKEDGTPTAFCSELKHRILELSAMQLLVKQ
jgi:hypothetical protein